MPPTSLSSETVRSWRTKVLTVPLTPRSFWTRLAEAYSGRRSNKCPDQQERESILRDWGTLIEQYVTNILEANLSCPSTVEGARVAENGCRRTRFYWIRSWPDESLERHYGVSVCESHQG